MTCHVQHLYPLIAARYTFDRTVQWLTADDTFTAVSHVTSRVILSQLVKHNTDGHTIFVPCV